MQPLPRPRKNLVILRAGDESLHKSWIAHQRRDFDLFISYYGKTDGTHQNDGEYYEVRPGPKWPCVADLLREHPQLVDQYDAFWFPDDDISATTDILNRMFALFHAFQLSLAQPALTRDSYHTWPHLLQRAKYVLRYCDFIEVMAPIFDRAALKACVHTFAESPSGWGLDWVWPQLCGRGRTDAIAVLDATPVRHTRPLGGNLYSNNPGLTPQRDEREILRKYQLEAVRDFAKYRPAHAAVAMVRLPVLERCWVALRKLNAKRLLRRRRS